MGHSRGGEAVVIAPIRASKPAGVTILGVLSLAPTDWGATSGPPTGYEFQTLLPAADGDVWSNDGRSTTTVACRRRSSRSCTCTTPVTTTSTGNG